MARTGLPTILSTGMATLGEIDEAVRAFRDAGGRDLVVLHCVSAYPAPPESLNLRKIATLARAFNVPAGFSDHSDGIVAAVVATALGACMVEKHFTLDKTLPGSDHHFSCDPAELRQLVDALRTAEAGLGHSEIGLTEPELAVRVDCHLSCVARVALRAGHALTAADIAFRRPGTGYPPALVDLLYDRRLARDIAAGHVIAQGDLQ